MQICSLIVTYRQYPEYNARERERERERIMSWMMMMAMKTRMTRDHKQRGDPLLYP